MESRRIGTIDVSIVGIGCNNFGARVDEAGTGAVVNAALDAGINFFDTADIYGESDSEVFLGRALRARRDEAVIATKFGMEVQGDPARSGGSARWIRIAVEDSLRRLGTDRIDLYQFHRPDDATPIDETLAALDDLVRAGKVREIGHSNFDGAQTETAEDVAQARGLSRFVSAQNQWSLLHPEMEPGVLEACRARGLALLPYFPLASGMLTGKYQRGIEPPPGTRLATAPAARREMYLSARIFDAVDRLTEFASQRGHSLLELAFAWLLAHDEVASVIAGATRPEQVLANAAAASWRLDPLDMSDMAALLP